ncbi:hypothetical protein BG011_008267 [Mortierella polycephala]|uniref:C2H2-type domain-containing protein n=1 Tax=Mortierella polycephala TaxID=41804 RepID=A0A9P6TXR1_9FUNG|nr:hypothetical protein BG011_008267 [Mortierella polycephala]
MPAYHNNSNEEDPHAWSGQPPCVPQFEHHLHQRPTHHPHPYSRPQSHSRSQSHSQQQFAHLVPPPPLPQHQSIQSTPPPRHASPVAAVARSRHAQEFYPERADPVRFLAAVPAFVPASAPVPVSVPVPAAATAPQHLAQAMQMIEEDDDQEGEVHVRANSQLSTAAGDEGTDVSKCPDCDKVYKHGTSLWKHRWEHSVYWKSATKFMLSKHQQVQMMEAAAILLGMDESRETDQDPVVGLMMRQRGQSATFTSISSVSPFTFTKSLSVSPPPMTERALVMKQESGAVMSPPIYYGRASNTTRHSVVSTTSTASSLSSTPPSLAPDDESVAEVEEEIIMTGHSFRPAQHHHHHHNPQQQHPYAQPPMMEMSQKHPESEFYSHDPRYPPYHHHHPQPPVAHPSHYAPYYHSQH